MRAAILIAVMICCRRIVNWLMTGHRLIAQALGESVPNKQNRECPKAPVAETGRCFMPLVQLVVILIVVGVLLGLINRYIPMAGSIKSILNGVVVIGVVVWLLQVFGLFSSLSAIRVGQLSWLGAIGA